MPVQLTDILFALPTYALVLFRVTGLMLTAPLLASNVIPARIRVALTMTLAAVIFPVVAARAPGNLDLMTAVTGGVGELMIGATIGLSLTLLMMGVEVAGLMVGRQGGLALGQVYDPAQNRQTTLVAQLYMIVLILMFLAVGGHREMIAALLDTFDVIPLMTFKYDESFVILLVEMLTSAFIIAIRLAGPVLIALFMLGTALGFLSRTMPQFNILTVGFTLRTMVAIGTAGLALSAAREVLLESVWDGMAMIRMSFGLDPA